MEQRSPVREHDTIDHVANSAILVRCNKCTVIGVGHVSKWASTTGRTTSSLYATAWNLPIGAFSNLSVPIVNQPTHPFPQPLASGPQTRVTGREHAFTAGYYERTLPRATEPQARGTKKSLQETAPQAPASPSSPFITASYIICQWEGTTGQDSGEEHSNTIRAVRKLLDWGPWRWRTRSQPAPSLPFLAT